MKIRKNYVLYINDMLGTATFGNGKFSYRLAANNVSIGTVYDCSFSQLKQNLKMLSKKGYKITQRKF